MDPAINNYFAPLAEITNTVHENEGTEQSVNTKPKMPPPIVIHQKVNDHKALINFITL